DFDLLPERASSTIERGESDRSILRIEQSMNCGPRRSHFCDQGAFAQLLFLHQVIDFQCHRSLERHGLNFLEHSVLPEEFPEATASMFVSSLNWFSGTHFFAAEPMPYLPLEFFW